VIVGCYTVDLYCDGCNLGYGHRRGSQYTGQTEAECLRQARRDGWLFTRDRPRKAFCPTCAATRRKGKRGVTDDGN
jgi:hypothetical protein